LASATPSPGNKPEIHWVVIDNIGGKGREIAEDNQVTVARFKTKLEQERGAGDQRPQASRRIRREKDGGQGGTD
jgi:hypothetical protein